MKMAAIFHLSIGIFWLYEWLCLSIKRILCRMTKPVTLIDVESIFDSIGALKSDMLSCE